jgi:hypothetical protein
MNGGAGLPRVPRNMQEGAECGRPLRPLFLLPGPGCLDGPPAHFFPVFARGVFVGVFDRLAGHGRGSAWNGTESLQG